MPNLLAVDVGYSQVKAVDGQDNKILFPSFVDRASSRGIELGGGFDETQMTCGGICKGKSYLVGGKSSVSLSLAKDFHGSPEWYVLMCNTLYEILRRQKGEAKELKLDYLGIGVPLDERTPEKIQEMEKFTTFEFSVAEVDYKATVNKVVVFPQGMAMLQTVGFDPDEEIGLIDIGYNTLDIMILDSGSLVNGSNRSLPLGINIVLKRIIDSFAKKTKGAKLSDRHAQKILRTKKKSYGRETISMANEVKEETEYYWDRLTKEIKPFWGDIKLLDRVVVGGGGAILLGDVFKDKLSAEINVEIMDDPVFGNVTGYMKSLRTLSKGK